MDLSQRDVTEEHGLRITRVDTDTQPLTSPLTLSRLLNCYGSYSRPPWSVCKASATQVAGDLASAGAQ